MCAAGRCRGWIVWAAVESRSRPSRPASTGWNLRLFVRLIFRVPFVLEQGCSWPGPVRIRRASRPGPSRRGLRIESTSPGAGRARARGLADGVVATPVLHDGRRDPAACSRDLSPIPGLARASGRGNRAILEGILSAPGLPRTSGGPCGVRTGGGECPGTGVDHSARRRAPGTDGGRRRPTTVEAEAARPIQRIRRDSDG